ncbi:HIT family protein [Streptococcus castoreus]|uniref:HIT family protein n=1 Tax=Streptococcus castoreus TaxID=254786 RepID=UPI0004122F7C|nr:HIT family protein [Streptococcus castoreus]
MENCIFCSIVQGDIPSSKIYEDEQVLAFLDISQTTPGHTLIIPKTHVRNVLEMDAKTASQLFSRVPKIARAIQAATGAPAMNIINNNEALAGQTVFHAHIHFIPRYDEKDGISIQYTTHEPDFPALATLAAQIRQEGLS